jgi:hypothetical protein
MNANFEPFDLVNTYGAFGSVDRDRYEVILEGTADDDPVNARWEEYELPCMPGPVDRRPCIVTPYHYRLDWQMWFVGNGAERGAGIERDPWLVHLIWQLLRGDPAPRSLFSRDPFPLAPPRWIRAGIWQYRFAVSAGEGRDTPDDGAQDEPAGRGQPSRRSKGRWWQRERVDEFLPPISRDAPALRRYVAAFGW